ncbi:MAG TPA: SDR family oxidoreductase [Chthonomonadaceae bacterium]|nr:SDR family oxidoreductase [Chthonomonadaceae bacterium]
MAQANGKLALITGANKGIGFETARQLARQGMKVLLGARDLTRGEQAATELRQEGLDVVLLQLDVSDPASIQRAAQTIEAEYGKLDILVNNAGIVLEDISKPISQTSPEVLHNTFDTNFFGPVELTLRLLPLLRKSDAGRIVNLSSGLASLKRHSDPNDGASQVKALAYNSSKTALNAFTIHLANELRNTPIKVNSADPGWVKTDMGGSAAFLEVADGAKTSVWLATLPSDGPTGGFFHLGNPVDW